MRYLATSNEKSFLYPHLPQHDDHSPHAGAPPKWEDLERIDGNQGGFNDGGLYVEKSTGEKWYVKFPESDDHAKNEVLAAKLYRACKIKFPETWVIKDPQGDLAVASRWVEGLRRDPKGLPEGKYNECVGDGIAVDAWLANWDQVGIGDEHPFGNMPVKDGKVVRIDPGGSLLYRGTGGRKGSFFTDHVTELGHYQSGSNRKQTAVYGHVKPDQIAKSILRVLKLSHDHIEKLVNEHGPGNGFQKQDLIQKLKSRQASLAQQYENITGKKPELG